MSEWTASPQKVSGGPDTFQVKKQVPQTIPKAVCQNATPVELPRGAAGERASLGGCRAQKQGRGWFFLHGLTRAPSQLPKSGSIGDEWDGGCPGATPGQGTEEAKGVSGLGQTGQQVWLPPDIL